MPKGATRSKLREVGKFKSGPTARPRLCVTFDEDVFDQVKHIARESGRSFSDISNAIIREELIKWGYLQ